MSGSLPINKFGPFSFQASGLILGGQLVIPTGSSGATAAPPGAGSAQTVMACTTANVSGLAAGAISVLGVAGNDGNVLTMPGLPSTNTYQQQQLDIAQEPDYVSVYPIGLFNIQYEASCAFGAALIAGVAGGVTPAGAAPDARTVIGRCMQAGGVVVSGTTFGQAWIMIVG